MKIKKYIVLLLIFLIFLNISSINATDNNASELEINEENTFEINENTLTCELHSDINQTNNEISSQNTCKNELLGQSNTNEILTQNTTENTLQINENQDLLSSYYDYDNGGFYNTKIILTLNDTSTFNTTNTATLNIHVEWDLYMTENHYNNSQILIYENNTLIQRININEINSSYIHDMHQTLDIPFIYAIKDKTEIKAILRQIESNALSFEKQKNITLTNLKNNTLVINNNNYSNENWPNTLKYLKKAISEAPENSIIEINDIVLMNDENQPVTIDKNITIIGKNATIDGLEKGTIFIISPESHVTLINLTFTNTTTNYLIKNNGDLKIIKSRFNNNFGRIIINNGNLTIENTTIENTISSYYTLSTFQIENTNENGLIYNTKNLILKNTVINNIEIHPITINNQKIDWDAIIVNLDKTAIMNSQLTNINYQTIYNNGTLEITKTLIENITTINTPSYKTQYRNQINNDYTYFSYEKTGKSSGSAIYNNNNLNISNSTFQTVTGSNGGAIYNNNNLEISNSTFQTITGSNGGAIYNNNNLEISNSTFQTVTGSDGGAIYNNEKLHILNTIFKRITGYNGGCIYNKNQLTIENSMLNNTRSADHTPKNYYDGGCIYNIGTCDINNSTITESKSTLHGGGIYNNGTLIVNNTTISKCDGRAGTGIYNDKSMTLTNCQIINNYQNSAENLIVNHGGWEEIFCIGSGIIFNNEDAQANISKSIIKDNTFISGHGSGGGYEFFGIIRNKGEMNIFSCVFDNNQGTKLYGYAASGGINIYNAGKITVMYSYLLNTKLYSGNIKMFLYNTKTATLNYNFYCLNPNSITNAGYNYYFVPTFEDDYYPVKLNDNTNITLTLKLTNGADTIDFNDWDKLPNGGLNTIITTLDENGTPINITKTLQKSITFNYNYTTTKGEYPITADISGYKINTIIDVGKEFPEMTVEYNNITYNDGNKITFHIKLEGNITTPTGNITLSYNNKKILLNLTNGECEYTITEKLKPNTYSMRIDYNGDDTYFKILKHYQEFTVHRMPTNITLSAPEIKIGQTGKVTITLNPGNVKLYGYISYKTDRIHEINADTQGTRTLDLKNFPVGVHNLTVIFQDDEYYAGGTASTLFIVSKYETNLTVEGSDIKAGENETLNITINPGDVRGNAVLKINNKTENIFINNDTTPITITNLTEGTYQVTVHYLGDAKYAESTATTTFSVSRITSHLTATLTQNDNLTGNITIITNPINCTGEVAIYINNDRTILNLTNGSIKTQIRLKRGNNYIYIHYNGDSIYSISTWNTSFNIEGIPVLTLETQNLASDKTGYVRVNLTDTNSIPYEYTNITIKFQNKTTTLTTDENGTVYYPIKTGAGTYTITATYQNASITKTLTVKTLTTLTLNIPNINQADDLIVYATLTDSSNNPLTADIQLKINNNPYTIPIINGKGSRNLGEFQHGTYTYTAIYHGDVLIYSSNAAGTFEVRENSYKITGNTNIVQYYGATKTYKIRLLNNNQPVKGEIITITIGKNTVNVKTDNQGYATLKLSLKAGKYTITATYKNIKVSNKITVKPTLITKNKKIKKGKTLTYTAKLLNKNGKPLKGKKITFKIKGKKYKAKTNKKGIAKIKVKNLKAGKYKIITTYGKQKNTNTVTVKKIKKEIET